ncbi:hypothetical protein U716_10255 [Rhodobacter capsulatus B6]|nr:hypothetical protein U716_10255 [Rhodobacter capsulatus B6]
MRGCPICLREDAQGHRGPAAEVLAMRGHWQLRDVTLCLRHRHLLVPLWRADARVARFDFAARFDTIFDDLMAGRFDRPLCEPSDFDLWLDHRLETGADATALAEHGLYPAASFCRLLGWELLRAQGVPETDEVLTLRAAQQAGFVVARQGEAAISAALMDLVAAGGGQREEPKAVFGDLLTKLRGDTLDDPVFDPFRRLLRDCILSVWPIAAGETVLGDVIPERRLHSLYSAAREIGVTEELLEPFLIEAGALVAGDPRFSNRRVFSAAEQAGLLAEIPTLVSLRTIRREIGASRTELERLVAEGCLTPRSRCETVRLRWSLTQAKDLLSGLQSRATSVPAEDLAWETLLSASHRSRQSLSALLNAVTAGELPIGTLGPGFSDLRLRRAEIDALVPAASAPQEPLIPATAFGISVGIKDKGRFRALIEAGQTPATRLRHPKTGIENIYMTEADIAAFHRRFVTIPTLVAETGRPIPELRAVLKRAGVTVFAPEGQDFGRLFLRDAAEAALRHERTRKP